MKEKKNIFDVLKELGISIWEYLAAPDMMSDGQKISFILVMKAAKKAREHHRREEIFGWRKSQFEKSLSVVRKKGTGGYEENTHSRIQTKEEMG